MQEPISFEMTIMRDGFRESLCPDAEAYMAMALMSGKYALLNDTFLVKNYGYVVGLALPGTEINGTELNTRQWYSLDGTPDLRSTIRTLTDRGEPKRIIVPGPIGIVPNRLVRDVYRNKQIQVLLDQVYEAARPLFDMDPTYFNPPSPV